MKAHFVLKLGTKEGERMHTLPWSLSFPICSVWVYAVKSGQNTWLGEGGFLWLPLRFYLGLYFSYQALSRRVP